METDRFTVLIISRSFILRTRNVSDRSCRENRNTHFVYENLAFYETMWKNTVEPSW
jgi:hypothetical protein